MAINVSFNGATIYKPGAYSKINIDLSGGFPLGPVGLIALFGESTKGRPGSEETDISRNVFTANDLTEVRDTYGSGPLVDAMSFLFAPASDGAIPGGAQAVYIYKTNASTRADLDIEDAYGTVRSIEWGVGGNTITYSAVETAEVAPVIASSAAFDETAATAGTFSVSVNGVVAGPFTVTGAYADNAALAAEAATWVIPSATVVVGGVDGASTITITMTADALANQKGWGKSLGIANTTGTALASLNITQAQSNSATESAMTVTLKQTRDLLQEQDTLGGNIVMDGRYFGAELTATVQVSATQVVLTSGANVATFDKSAYATMLQLVNAMNLTTGWNFALSSTLYNSLPISVLDIVTVGAKALLGSQRPVRIKKDAQEVADFFADSSIADIIDQADTGLMDAASEVALSGGSLGGTSTASIVAALTAFQEIRVNSVIPLMSRDASQDITDNLTDATSNYTLLGIHQAIKTHCALMSTTKNRSERQGYLSMKDTFDNCLDRAALLADARMQLAIQDIRNIDAQGTIKWFQPWAQACMLAGARAGSPVGTPLTFKFFNCTGIRHTEQPMSTPEEDIIIDFNPNAKYEEAIRGGITFFEVPQSGGIRCVVDNTTYQKDGNWVYNRGNVLYAADVLAFDFRNQMENIYIGQKNTVKASEVKSVAASILATYLAQGITVATDEAPNGYKKIDVAINGNVINITVIVVLVEGIDFVLADITITRVQSEA
jgi:hypothetical protein